MAISVKPIGQRKEKRNQKDKKFRQFVFNIAAEWKRTIHTIENNSILHYSTVDLYFTVLGSSGKSFSYRIKLDYQPHFLLKGKVLNKAFFESVTPKA